MKGMVTHVIKRQEKLCDVIDSLDLKPIPFKGSVVVTLDTVDEVEQYAAAKHLPKDIRKQWLYNVAHDTPIILGYSTRDKIEQLLD